MGGLFGGAPKMPPPAPPAPTTDTAAVEDAARRERMSRVAAGGRASTILTGGMGDTSTPASAKATLLGQ